jgi:hypothetical protein
VDNIARVALHRNLFDDLCKIPLRIRGNVAHES